MHRNETNDLEPWTVAHGPKLAQWHQIFLYILHWAIFSYKRKWPFGGEKLETLIYSTALHLLFSPTVIRYVT